MATINKEQNSITWVRRVMLNFLRSYFRHSEDFPGYSDDDLNSTLVVMDSTADMTKIPDKAERVIVHRLDLSGETVAVKNEIEHNNQMFTHGAFIPKLGMLGIYCEARNNVEAEFIADHIESILLLHRDDLNEKSVGVGTPRISTVNTPVSGTGLYSVVVSVPVHTVSKISFSHKDSQMVSSIGLEFGIGTAALIQAKT